MRRILFIFAIGMASQAFANQDQDVLPLLTVTGQGKTNVKATLADVRIGIEVDGKSAVEVQKALAANVQPVLATLKKLNPDNLETGVISITPSYNDNKPPTIVGYKGSTEIVFTKESSKAGELIDEALKAGANKLNSVSLRPSDEAIHDARIASLQKACRQAMEEAEVVMKALKIQSKGIRQVEIQNEYHPGPIPLRYAASKAMSFAMNESTEILEQEQPINANVSIKLDLK